MVAVALKLIQRNGVSMWWIRRTVCGTRVYRSTKLTDRRLAEKYCSRITREIESAFAAGIPVARTFNDACSAYLEAGGSDRFLVPLRQKIGKKLLRDIAQPDLDKLAKKLYPTGRLSTLNRQVYTPFIAVWNFATENEWARVRKWRRPRRPRGTNVSLTTRRAGTAPVSYADAAKFVGAMSPAPAMLMTFLFYTGLRPIEAFALDAGDVDLAKRWLVVRTSKTGEPRGVPVHSWLAGWLPDLVDRGLSDGKGALFRTTKGEPYTAVQHGGGGLKTAVMLARKRSGIADVSPYTARHSCSTGLVVAGVHPHIKDQILGHAADSMSRYYTDVPQTSLIEAIDKLPVPEAWRSMPWWEDPLGWSRRLVEGTGRRTDLL